MFFHSPEQSPCEKHRQRAPDPGALFLRCFALQIDILETIRLSACKPGIQLLLNRIQIVIDAAGLKRSFVGCIFFRSVVAGIQIRSVLVIDR